MVLLWTNNSPTSDFASQEISANYSGFDHLIIVLKATKSSNIYAEVLVPTCGDSGFAWMSSGASFGNAASLLGATRSVTFSSGNKITIGDCRLSYNGGAYNDIRNDIALPYQIYGLRA